jgi:hypothetical protein
MEMAFFVYPVPMHAAGIETYGILSYIYLYTSTSHE